MELQDDFESYSGVGTDAIYCTDLSGIYKQCCETETEERIFGSTLDKEVNDEQRVEKESADVVNANPKMALISESSCLHGGDEQKNWISAAATSLAQPQSQFSSKQNFTALSLSLQLPASVAIIPRSNALPNTSASRTAVLTNGSGSASDCTG